MKNRLEIHMQEKLDAASLKDIMPDFDQESMWASVQEAMPEAKSKKGAIGLRWVVRAAAAVLLLAVGLYAVLHSSISEKAQPAPLVNNNILPTPPKTTTALPIPQPPIALQPTQEDLAIKPTPTPPTRQMQLPRETTANHIAQQALANTNQKLPEIIDSVPPSPTPIIAAKTTPKKVTHYLDIDPETPDAGSAENVAGTPFIQIKLNKPGYTDDVPQKAPLKELVFALGK